MNCQTDKEKYSMVLKCVLGPTHWTTTEQAIKQTKKIAKQTNFIETE